MLRRTRSVAMAVSGVAAAALISSCGIIGGDDGPSITVYNAQHEELLEEIAPALRPRRPASTSSCATARTSSWPTSSCRRGRVSGRRLPHRELPRDVARRQRGPVRAGRPRRRSRRSRRSTTPSDGNWMGFAARSTVLVYNTDADQRGPSCPTSIMDLADPEWAGRVAFSPTGADFQAIVSAVLELEGERRHARRGWTGSPSQRHGLRRQRRGPRRRSTPARSTPGSSTTTTGTATRRSPATTATTRSSTSSATRTPARSSASPAPACSQSSDKQDDAQQFVEFLTSDRGPAGARRQLRARVPAQPGGRRSDPPVKPFDELEPPRIDLASLNGPRSSS